MYRWCAWCQKYIGEREPFDSYEVSHGVCERCFTNRQSLSREQIQLSAPLKDFFYDVKEAATSGKHLNPEAIYTRSQALGIQTIDLFIGLIQPLLVQIGELYGQKKVTAVQEHIFTDFCQRLLFLCNMDTRKKKNFEDISAHVILTGIEGNYHTLGIQILELFLNQEGISAQGFFPSLPDDEIIALVKEKKPAFLGLSVATTCQYPSLERLLSRLIELPDFLRPEVLLGGYAIKMDPPRYDLFPYRICPPDREHMLTLIKEILASRNILVKKDTAQSA